MRNVVIILSSIILCSSAFAEEHKHSITGLFSPDRVDDLQQVVATLPNIKLVRVDYATAEATFDYDPAVAFADTKPEPDKIVERFDGMLKQASRHTFGCKALRTTALDKLTMVEVSVAGLDCKGCCLAAYDAVYRLPGVECATASFKAGKVTALLDPEKADRAMLEAALKQRGVEIKAR
jgi:copper chaperone CopZ